MRRQFGHAYVPAAKTREFNAFCKQYLNPFLNMHRPCLFGTEVPDAKKPGRLRRIHRHDGRHAPLDKFASLPNAASFLRDGITLEDPLQEARRLTDVEAARQLRDAREDRRPPEACRKISGSLRSRCAGRRTLSGGTARVRGTTERRRSLHQSYMDSNMSSCWEATSAGVALGRYANSETTSVAPTGTTEPSCSWNSASTISQVGLVDSTGGCNTLELCEQRECCHEAKTANLLYGDPEGPDVGAMAQR